MDQRAGAGPIDQARRRRRVPAVLLAILLVAPITVTACTGTSDDPAATGRFLPAATDQSTGATTHAPTHAPGAGMKAAAPPDADAAWLARPSFVRTAKRTESAYAYALDNPHVLAWIPCYCGCGGMGHESNLDCFIRRAAPGRPTQFEEHGSYCTVCIDTALMVKQLLAEGKTLREARAVIDGTFGGLAPGTDTPLPAG